MCRSASLAGGSADCGREQGCVRVIKVTRELARALREGAEQVVLQLANARPASLASEAMRAACDAVMSADQNSPQPDTPSFVSGVAEHRGGPTLLFDTSSMSEE